LLDAGLALNPAVESACEYLIVYLVDPVPPTADPDYTSFGFLRPLRVFSTEVMVPAIIRHLTGRQYGRVGPQRRSSGGRG
jgi:hypothetical protein